MVMTRKQKFEELMNRNPGLPLELLKEVVRDWEEIEKESKMDSLVFPFDSQEFLDTWDIWKKYRSQKGKKPYKQIGEQAALKKLARLSEGEESRAIFLIEHAMAENWEGFWAVKESNGKKEKRVTDDYKQSILKDLYSD